jgi:hypothetical protein
MAKYSNDAKYVSAYNKAVASAKTAKTLLAKLNSTKPDTAGHVTLKAQYDAAKKVADRDEAARLARKKEIDDAVTKEKEEKDSSKTKVEAQADIRQLDYERQLAINSGDKAAQAKAEADLKAAKDRAAGIKPPAPGAEDGTDEAGFEDVTKTKFKDYTVNTDGSVVRPGGIRVYFVGVKNADGSVDLNRYESIAEARDAFLTNYSKPGELEALKQQMRARNWISAKQLENGEWLTRLDGMLAKYTFDAVSSVKYGGAKEAPPIDSWFSSAKGGAGGSGTDSKAGTFKDTDLDLTTIGDAYKEINDYMVDALGRNATQEEKDAYYKDINEREKKSAVQTVTVRDATGKVTNTTRTGDRVTPEERLNVMNKVVIKTLEGTDAAEILKSGKGSQVAVQIGKLQKAAADYGQPMSAGEALKYVIAGGTEKDAIAKQTERMRLNSMTMYSNLKDHIRDGGNVKDIADQYALIKAKKLGIPVTDAFNDKDIQMALTKDGGLMSTAEFSRQMQANPLWRQTEEAREVASDFANTILKSFGFMG